MPRAKQDRGQKERGRYRDREDDPQPRYLAELDPRGLGQRELLAAAGRRLGNVTLVQGADDALALGRLDQHVDPINHRVGRVDMPPACMMRAGERECKIEATKDVVLTF